MREISEIAGRRISRFRHHDGAGRIAGGLSWAILCVIIGLTFPGCSWLGGARQSASAPTWVNQPTGASNTGFLRAVGSGDSREAAIDAAFQRLAQTIEVRIVGRESASTLAQRRQNNRVVSDSVRARIESEIHLLVDQSLPGVSVEAVYFDQASATHYAQVSLDRLRTAMQLDGEAMESARQARLALIESSSIKQPWARLQKLDEAKESLKNASNRKRASDAVAGAGGLSRLSSLQLEELDADVGRAISQARSSLRIAVSAVDRGSAELADEVRSTLIARGLAIARAEPTLLLRCSVTITPLRSFDQHSSAAQWSVKIELFDASRRVMLDTLRLTGSVVSRNDSRTAALRAATQRAVEELPEFLSLALQD